MAKNKSKTRKKERAPKLTHLLSVDEDYDFFAVSNVDFNKNPEDEPTHVFAWTRKSYDATSGKEFLDTIISLEDACLCSPDLAEELYAQHASILTTMAERPHTILGKKLSPKYIRGFLYGLEMAACELPQMEYYYDSQDEEFFKEDADEVALGFDGDYSEDIVTLINALENLEDNVSDVTPVIYRAEIIDKMEGDIIRWSQKQTDFTEATDELIKNSSEVFVNIIKTLPAGHHHLVNSNEYDMFMISLDKDSDDAQTKMSGDHELFARSFAHSFLFGGGVVVRTQHPDDIMADGTLRWEVSGYALGKEEVIGLSEAEIFSAYCTDAETGEPIPPEYGVDYMEAVPLEG